MFDKLLDSDVKKWDIIYFENWPENRSSFRLFLKPLEFNLHFHNLGRRVEQREKSSKYFGNRVWSKCLFS